jgi:hypothetical protein
MQDGAESWRSISARSKAHNFVIYREHAGSESKTLRIGENVAVILDLLNKPRSAAWILGRFPVADARMVRAVLDDLCERGVLRNAAHSTARTLDQRVKDKDLCPPVNSRDLSLMTPRGAFVGHFE